jgi:uncharacterized protein
MGFIALIRLLALALAAWLIWRFILQRRKPLPKSKTADEVLETKMVKCAVCDTHIPRADALSANERWYCSEEHRDQDLDQT